LNIIFIYNTIKESIHPVSSNLSQASIYCPISTLTKMSHAALYTAEGGSHVIPTLLAGLHVTGIYCTGHYTISQNPYGVVFKKT